MIPLIITAIFLALFAFVVWRMLSCEDLWPHEEDWRE